VNISLTVELDQFVKQQVESGMYHSASEVIRDGLRLLREREQLRQIRLEELRKQLAIGLEQLERGEYAVMDETTFAHIKAEGERRLAELRKQEVRHE
jgi:antitoxin ParD1/3/4